MIYTVDTDALDREAEREIARCVCAILDKKIELNYEEGETARQERLAVLVSEIQALVAKAAEMRTHATET